LSYKSETMATVVMNRLNINYFLPAIQREFVWTPEQILRLFDSLMRGYPISSFLFWELKPENHEQWEVYRFIEHAKEGGTHNQIANSAGVQQLTLVLDGQQRLTALSVGLRGFYETKRKYLARSNPNAWVKKRLYLNLFKDPRTEEDSDDGGMRYDFQFLGEGPKNDLEHYWFKIGRILDFDSRDDFDEFRMQELEKLPQEVTKGQMMVFERNLDKLYRAVWENPTIWYYTEHDQNFDRVLDIFVRANAGGTTLTKSDLLLSTVIAKWRDINAREEIYGLVDRVNDDLTRKNNLDKDFVMKSCLVLSDLPVAYRVQNFNNKNLETIYGKWDKIKAAIEKGVDLVNTFGVDRDTLTSQNALIPVLYYLYSLDGPTLQGSTPFEVANAAAIRRWLLAAMLNNVFSGSSDNILRDIRQVLAEHLAAGNGDFPVEAINRRVAASGRTTWFDEYAAEEVLSIAYGKRRTFLALSLLYERTNWGTLEYHQDHIFPRSLFTKEHLEAAGVPPEKWARYGELRDRLGNLELLLSYENEEKSDKPFGEWISTRDESFRQTHLIPDDNALLRLERFEDFVAAREDLIRQRLKHITA
jgi:uncharacterized protein with ParB-like and HNH nuclease domain